MSRLGREIWADLEAAMHKTAEAIRSADIHGVEVWSGTVAELAAELRDAAAVAFRAPRTALGKEPAE